ncbi:MAG: hypothetical protein ACM3X4_08685 [Ignavibacteriales bacterium]
MRIERNGYRRTPVPVVPESLQHEQASRLQTLVGIASQKGEFLMKCWLDVLVASDDLIDNCRPGFLCNPLTGEPLEFDRFYLEGVAFEFNGRQHYRPTSAYPDEQTFRERRARDLLKKGLSQEKGIVLVEVTSADLTLENMEKKIPDVLPRSVVDREGPYVKALSRLCKDYLDKTAQSP